MLKKLSLNAFAMQSRGLMFDFCHCFVAVENNNNRIINNFPRLSKMDSDFFQNDGRVRDAEKIAECISPNTFKIIKIAGIHFCEKNAYNCSIMNGGNFLAMHSAGDYPRDLAGRGEAAANPQWPGKARVALQFVLNYEEGGERCILHGDSESESFLSEIAPPPFANARHMTMESVYEYGSRIGVWRILDLFRERQIPITIFAVASAMLRYAAPIERAMQDGHEICSHGWRWINYHGIPEAEERADIQKAIAAHSQVCGARPLGWYAGRTSENTRRLVAEEGGFLYDADDYSDDLPFWSRMTDSPHLIVPYTLDANDMRFALPHGFCTGGQFYEYLRDSFDGLHREGEAAPKMMSVGLHARIIGRPGRLESLRRFLNYALSHDDVWFARRIDIARHWREHFPPPTTESKKEKE